MDGVFVLFEADLVAECFVTDFAAMWAEFSSVRASHVYFKPMHGVEGFLAL